jgi:hypothetical protein
LKIPGEAEASSSQELGRTPASFGGRTGSPTDSISSRATPKHGLVKHIQYGNFVPTVEPEEDKPLIGFLQNLNGNLAAFNGRLVRPKQLPPDPGNPKLGPRFSVLVDNGFVQLVVGSPNFHEIVDRDAGANKIVRATSRM